MDGYIDIVRVKMVIEKTTLKKGEKNYSKRLKNFFLKNSNIPITKKKLFKKCFLFKKIKYLKNSKTRKLINKVKVRRKKSIGRRKTE